MDEVTDAMEQAGGRVLRAWIDDSREAGAHGWMNDSWEAGAEDVLKRLYDEARAIARDVYQQMKLADREAL